MDTVPRDIDLQDVVADLEAIKEVDNAHHVHAWALTSGKYLFSAHLQIAETANPLAVLDQAQTLIRDQHGFYFSTIQTEIRCEDPDPAAAIDFADSTSHQHHDRPNERPKSGL